MVYSARIHQDNTGGFVKVTYDFAVHGGAIGTILLPLKLPNKDLILYGVADVIVAPTSGGSATIALGANTTTDLKAATAIASWTGRVALIPDFAAANAVKLTAERQLQLTVATAALTAGKINFHLFYGEE